MTLLTPKGCPEELIFGDFSYQPIPPNFYDFLNNDDDDENKIPGTPVYDVLPVKRRVEDSVVLNDEEIDDDIIIYDADRLISDNDPLQDKMMEMDGVDAKNEGVDSEFEGVENDS